MKKLAIKLIFAVVLFSGMGCKKWLDLKPQDGITGAEFWKTKEQVNSAVVGCYASLLGSQTGARAIAESFFLWGELRADMIYATATALPEEIDIVNVNILPTNAIANWRGVYQTINYCNTVIDHAPDVLSRDATFTQDALKKYIAEVKAIRALMYFYLVRTFGEVPLKLKSTSSDNEIEQLPKSTQQVVLTQVLKDLSEAEPDAVFSYGTKAADKGRITKYTINAIQADVNLWMDNYTDCITACNKIINSNQFGLIDGSSQSAWFSTLFANGNSNESIFEFQFDVQKPNPFYQTFVSRKKFIASPIVLEQIYTQDFVDPLKFDIRADGGSVRAADGGLWKYMGWSPTPTAIRGADEFYAHWFVYRYADILLMKAEALNESGDGAGALSLVYTIRARAHALVTTDPAPSPSDKLAIADFILAERAREFAFEGKRWFDLLRNAKRNNYARLDLLTGMVSGTVPPDRQQSAIAKFKDHNSHYLPIYSYELQTDKQLVQNPFYK